MAATGVSLTKFLEASEFLQNVVYINIPLTEEEKIERYNTLSQLYMQIGMVRKAGFFHRIAAMQCVAPNNPKPAWNTCYYILLQALAGYRISLDPKDTPIDHVEGWPATQLRVLHELIYSSRKMGNPAIAIRHITYLFHTLFDYLSREERIELVSILRSYTSRCEGGAQTLALENGLIVPPVPFYKFPRVYSFNPDCPSDHMLPCKYQKKKCASTSQFSTSPFIYSPMQTASVVKEKSAISEMEFDWVEGEKCVVEVEAQNPLPIPLDVNDIGLLTEGVVFEGSPCNVVIPAHTRAKFNITGTVPQAGALSILGYQTTVFGCRSKCRFRDMHHLEQSQFNVKVVPRLPEMCVSLSSQRKVISNVAMKHGTVTSAALSVYAGQNCECEVRLKNTGQLSIDMVDIELSSDTDKDLLKEMLVWNQFNVNSQLPVRPGGHASFTLYINSEHLSSHQHQTLSGQLLFQYSGSGGLEVGYCRCCSLAFTLSLLPVVNVKAVELQQAKRSASECQLSLLVENCVSQEVILSSQPDTSFLISSHADRRCSFHVQKCSFPVDHLEEVPFSDDSAVANETQSFNSTIQMNQSQTDPTNPDYSGTLGRDKHCTLTNEITQHLKNFLDVRWKIPKLNVDGKMQVNCNKWGTDLLETMVTGPLNFELEVNGLLYEPLSRVHIKCGVTVVIRCSAINTSDCDITDVELCVGCNDHAFNSATPSLHSSGIVMGQNGCSLTSLSPKARLAHDWELLYFCPGLYEVHVSASGSSQILSRVLDSKDVNNRKTWTSVPVLLKVE